jgi:hypothetical protein
VTAFYLGASPLFLASHGWGTALHFSPDARRNEDGHERTRRSETSWTG